MDGQTENLQSPIKAITRRKFLTLSGEAVALAIASPRVENLDRICHILSLRKGDSAGAENTEPITNEIIVNNGAEFQKAVSEMTPEYFEELKARGINTIIINLSGENDYMFNQDECTQIPIPNSYPSESDEPQFSTISVCLPFTIPEGFLCSITSSGSRKKIVFPSTSGVGISLQGGGTLHMENCTLCGGRFIAHPEMKPEERPTQGYFVIQNGWGFIDNTTLSTQYLEANTSEVDHSNMSGIVALTDKAKALVTNSNVGTSDYPMHWDSFFGHLGGSIIGFNSTFYQDKGCAVGTTGKNSTAQLTRCTVTGPNSKGPWKGFGLWGESSTGLIDSCNFLSSVWGLGVVTRSSILVKNTVISGTPNPVCAGGEIEFDGKNRIIIRREPHMVENKVSADGFDLSGPLERAKVRRFGSVSIEVPTNLDFQINGITKQYVSITDKNQAIKKRLASPAKGILVGME